MKMNKEFVATVAGAAMLMTSTAFAAEPITAKQSTDYTTVNGNFVSMYGYQINGNNYYKLRDLAYALKGTGGEFSVDFDNGSIFLNTKGTYTQVGGELSPSDKLTVNAKKNNCSIYVDNNIIDVTAYEIDGYNYLKLRDICGAVGVDVGYDDINRTVSIVPPSVPTTQTTPDKQEVNNTKPSVSYNGSWITPEAREMLGYINELRRNADLPDWVKPLVLDEDLCHGAMIRAQEATHEMAHYRPDGRTYKYVMGDFEHVDKNGYRLTAEGENLAFEYGTAKEAFDAWVASPGHHAAMGATHWVRLGVGFNGNGTWVLLFSAKEV